MLTKAAFFDKKILSQLSGDLAHNKHSCLELLLYFSGFFNEQKDQQHLFETEILINVFTVNFAQLIVSLLNTSINFKQQKLILTPKI